MERLCVGKGVVYYNREKRWGLWRVVPRRRPTEHSTQSQEDIHILNLLWSASTMRIVSHPIMVILREIESNALLMIHFQ